MKNLLRKNLLWSMALYEVDKNFSFNSKLSKPFKVFNTKKIRRSKKHYHTFADPFVFSKNGLLYIFFESQAISEFGKIEAVVTKDLKEFEFLGVVLAEDYHLSYPFVFESDQSIYMLPESNNANEINLYKFHDFPKGVQKFKTLLKGNYNDSAIIKHEGTWYLFTTSKTGLEIYYADNIFQDELKAHPQNPISTDTKYSRNGGAPLILNGDLYRIAQDCSADYGRNLNILKIKLLSKTNYKEELVVDDFFECQEQWNLKGGHHFSLANFNNKVIVAIDGKHEDYLINKFLSPIFKIF